MDACPHRKYIAIPNGPFYKEECTKCFDTDLSVDGLDVCLSCANGACTGSHHHSQLHFEQTGHPLVCNIRRRKLPPMLEDHSATVVAPITRLAIGVSGGLAVDGGEQTKYETCMTVRCLKCRVTLDSQTPEVPAHEHAQSCNIKAAITAVEKSDSFSKALATCQSCAVGSSLWLCLTCGALGCSRKNFDGTGGNGHAVSHFEATGHPLVCKMGTITPEGTADIYCYRCDESRLDTEIASHLAHFGLAVSQQVKSAKSMAELDLEFNLSFDWSRSYEAGRELSLVFGPGRTGLANLGNSCYVASVLQCLFAQPTFIERYYVQGAQHLLECRAAQPASCFGCQMAKMSNALRSGEYSTQPAEYSEWRAERDAKRLQIESMDVSVEDQKTILSLEQDSTVALYKDWQPGCPPRMFKSLMAGQNAEFQSNRQQDALEYAQHMLAEVSRRERQSGVDPTSCFEFQLESRLECLECHRVRYNTTTTSNMALRIPINEELLKLKDASGQMLPLPAVEFSTCLQLFAAAETLEAYNCAHCRRPTRAVQNTRFKTFPEVLLIQMLRFVSPAWVPIKLNVSINMPDKVDLEPLRSHGLLATELPMPETLQIKGAGAEKPVPNAEQVSGLMAMGFTENACKRAVLAVSNAGVEEASAWLFNHLDDADLNASLKSDVAPSVSASPAFDELALVQLCSMGFDEIRVKHALTQTAGDPDRAADWLFSHVDDEVPSIAAPIVASRVREDNSAPAHFELSSFITHLGVSTGCGHYVSHVRQADQSWVYFNDTKVSTSVELPKDQAYIYLLSRVSSP